MGLPASSPGLLDQIGRASAGDRAARVRYRRALMLMVMTLVVPGSAQLVAGNRQVGRIATRIWAGLVLLFVAAMGAATLHHQYVFWFVSDTTMLGVVRLALMVLAVGWAALFLDAWRIGQPLSLTIPHARWWVSTASSASPSPGRCCSAPIWSGCSAASSSRCSPVTRSPAATTDGSTCSWSAATPVPGAGGCVPTR